MLVYLQGKYKDWGQQACDKTFMNNMRVICLIRHTRKRSSWWRKARIAGELGYDMMAWKNLPEDSMEHCLHGARMFYKAVYGFGDVYYGKKDYVDACKRPCAQLGNPFSAESEFSKDDVDYLVKHPN